MIKLLIVDDHQVIRNGIADVLSKDGGIYVIGSAISGEEAIDMVIEHRPHVVFMDLQMPGIGGIEATRRILRIAPSTKVIILTAMSSSPLPEAALEVGAVGYITKSADTQEMLRAVRSVCKGMQYVSRDIAQQLAIKSFNKHLAEPFATLSMRETQISILIVNFQKVREIAQHLSLSPKTINSYRYRIFTKLGISSDMELAILAIRHKLVDVNALPSIPDLGNERDWVGVKTPNTKSQA